jgi:preprotein translocase subunit SecF
MEVQTPKAADLPSLRNELSKLSLGSINVQEFGGENQIMLRIGQQDGGDSFQKKAIDAVRQTIGEDANYRRVEYVGPQVGKELIAKGVWAVALSTIGVLAYLLIRFQWQFAVTSIVALVHDTILTLGLFTVTRAEFDLATLAAVLMIAGYSINDTVVVFDRVREMMQKYRKLPLLELFNKSINSTLSRTIMTGLTSIGALLALWFLGGTVIRGFVAALIWGIFVGTYSSVFIATPMLKYMGMGTLDKARQTADSKIEASA